MESYVHGIYIIVPSIHPHVFIILLMEESQHQLVDGLFMFVPLQSHYLQCFRGKPIVTNWCQMSCPSTVFPWFWLSTNDDEPIKNLANRFFSALEYISVPQCYSHMSIIFPMVCLFCRSACERRRPASPRRSPRLPGSCEVPRCWTDLLLGGNWRNGERQARTLLKMQLLLLMLRR